MRLMRRPKRDKYLIEEVKRLLNRLSVQQESYTYIGTIRSGDTMVANAGLVSHSQTQRLNYRVHQHSKRDLTDTTVDFRVRHQRYIHYVRKARTGFCITAAHYTIKDWKLNRLTITKCNCFVNNI